MKKKLTTILFSILFTFGSISGAYAAKKSEDLIQLAILLDSSGSMDGLIDQAKSQLWKIVNDLALAKKDGVSPNLEVALYEYGKSSYSKDSGYLKMLVPLSTDLDKISEELFKIKTNGGDEYCGRVIQEATNNLSWSKSNDDLKIIIIAGNEPFTQGRVNYKTSCKKAISKGIMINTIFCGAERTGINTMWKDGALLADGKYMVIDQNEQIVHINAPQDDEIRTLGNKLNKTYIGYGKKAGIAKKRQLAQDEKAKSMSGAGMVQRTLTKASKFYKNSSWDLVDAVEEEEVDIEEIKKEELPAEMKEMKNEERKKYLSSKKKERNEIQKKIKKLNKERRVYVENERSKLKKSKTLDAVIIDSLRSQAKTKSYNFE